MRRDSMRSVRLVLASTLVLLLQAYGASAEEKESPPERQTREQLDLRAAQTVDRLGVGAVARKTIGSGPTLTWTSLGPEPIEYDYWANGQAAGRVSAIAVNPANADIVYIAAAQGGVWKSIDGGDTWTVLTDQLSSIASGALALDPADPEIVYYGTGEMHQSGDSYYGDGLFRSPDGGTSWNKIAARSSVGSYISRVAVHADNPSIIYVTSSLGFVRSADGGANWAATLTGDWCFDLALDPTDNDVVYTTMASLGVYKSIDAGQSWTPLAGGLPGFGFDRINLAISNSNPSVLYASFVTPGGQLFGMYRTSDGGTTWSLLAGTPNYCGSQGWYDNCVAVDPTDPDICYAGGMYPYGGGDTGVIRTLDGGATWVDVTFGVDGSAVHPDQQILTFGPDGALWLGNDGGVWKTTDRGATWINRNAGLDITQFYTAAIHPDDHSILGGTQDNGSLRWDGAPVWPQVIAGDGGYCLFRWDDPRFYYTTYVGLNPVYQWFDDFYNATVTGPWVGDRASFLQGPLVQDYDIGNSLLAGTYRVWGSTDGGSSWSSLSGNLTESSSAVLRALSPARSSATIYSGSSNGRVYRTDDGVVWTPRQNGLPRKAVNDIWVDPAAPLTAYLCADTTAGGRVFKTDDGGANWISASGDLPINLHGLCLAVDYTASPPRLYLGTDYGVYSSADDGASWIKEDAALPNCAVFDLAIDPVDGALFAATHGRGMWRGAAPVLAVGDAPVALTSLLLPVAPNPSRAPVTLRYRLGQAGPIALEVFDLAGRRLRVVERGSRPAGAHEAVWDGRDESGLLSGDGVYFYRLTAGARTESGRLVLVR